MPQPPDIYVIIGKFLSGTIEEGERQQLEDWRKEHLSEFARLKELWETNTEKDYSFQYRQHYQQQKLNQRIDAWEAEQAGRKIRNYRPLKLAAASISLLLISAIAFLFYDDLRNVFLVENQEWIVKQTARSQIATFTLVDGTKVKLNADSKFRYAKHSTQTDQREVFLEGEAYFEVTHNPSRPFVVRTDEVDIRVLGTSFSVDAYPEDTTTGVIVASGKVAVNMPSAQSSEVLLPAQQVMYYKPSQQWIKREVDVTQQLAWTEGKLLFQNADMGEVAKILERYYDVTIRFAREELKACRFTASFQRETLVNVLEAINYINNMDYKYENGTVVLSGPDCTF